MDDTDRASSQPVSADRAHTLVLRCWFERSAGEELRLRGTLRDLSRGRSIPFEGLPSLILQLRLALGDGTMPQPDSSWDS